MNKENLLKIYTAEQLADMYLLVAGNYDKHIKNTGAIMDDLKYEISALEGELKEKQAKIDKLEKGVLFVDNAFGAKEWGEIEGVVNHFKIGDAGTHDSVSTLSIIAIADGYEICEVNGRKYISVAEHEKLKAEKQTEINQLKRELDKAVKQIERERAMNGNLLNEIDSKNKENTTELLLGNPMEVAGMLINAEEEYELSELEKALRGTDKGTYRIFSIPELRRIAGHLLVYCNHNGEVGE